MLTEEFLQNEIDQLSTELDRIASTTQYNGINVLDGTYANKVFQIGANAGQTMNISIGNMSSNVLGVATSNSAAVSNASTSTHNGYNGWGYRKRYRSSSNCCQFRVS